MDIRTIYEITAAVLFFLYSFILIIRYSTPLLRGVRWIAHAYLCGAVSLTLMLLRGHIPLFITIVVANLLLALVNVFLCWAIQEILRTRRRTFWILPAVFLPTAVLFPWFTYVHNQIIPRIVTYSILAIAGEIFIALLLLYNENVRTRLPRTVLSICFFLWSYANLRRMIGVLRRHPHHLFLEAEHLNQWMLLVPLAVVMLIALGLVWLTTAYLQIDLEDLARTDTLTGLLNRRAIESDGVRAIAASREQELPLSLILIDLDHFKAVNDAHGHAAGDIALTTAAACIRRNLREYELIARFGGAEFLVLLPNTSAETAANLAERLRACLADLTVPLLHGEVQLSGSFGVTSFQAASDSWDDLLHRADQALYKAKLAGRNRIAVA